VPSLDLESQLVCRTQAPINGDIHARMAIAAGDVRLTAFAIAGGAVTFDSTLDPDVTFVFHSAETALAILSGTDDPIAAFLDGRFRSDGHLPLAFVLLGLFRPGADITPPP